MIQVKSSMSGTRCAFDFIVNLQTCENAKKNVMQFSAGSQLNNGPKSHVVVFYCHLVFSSLGRKIPSKNISICF